MGPADTSKTSQTRAQLFDITFLMLCHIIQLHGMEVHVCSCISLNWFSVCELRVYNQWKSYLRPMYLIFLCTDSHWSQRGIWVIHCAVGTAMAARRWEVSKSRHYCCSSGSKQSWFPSYAVYVWRPKNKVSDGVLFAYVWNFTETYIFFVNIFVLAVWVLICLRLDSCMNLKTALISFI